MDAKTVVGAFAMLATGCASVPQLPSIPPGEPVAILTAAAPPGVDLYNNAMGQGAGTGAKSGMLIGAMWGAACGPWFLVCMPITALFGSGVGAVSGTAVGAMQGPDAGQRERLAERLRGIGAARDPQAELSAAIATMARGRWRIEPASPVAVAARIDEIALHARRGDRVVLGVKATVSVRGVVTPGSREPDSKVFAYLGPEADLRLWLEDPDGFVSEAFSHAIRHLAREAYSELSR